jgi:flagellar P-ring protein precursor FlgI
MLRRTHLALVAAAFHASVFLSVETRAAPVRVKDLVTIQGADPVEVYGYGLVIGLNGTGDGRSISYTRQSISNMLERMGLSVQDERVRARNVASVMVTSTITPWDRPGSLVDLNVSSIGDATSLSGGVLLLTELRGPNQVLYAIGQGPLSVGGFDAASVSGARVRRNHVTAGRVPEGGRISASPEFTVPSDGRIRLLLDEPDFTASFRIAGALNEFWQGATAATPLDAGGVLVELSSVPNNPGFAAVMATLEEVTVEPAVLAKVVINERTGTLVAGGGIRLQAATVSHGNLQVRIESELAVSQPPPFSSGQTTVVPQGSVEFETGRGGVVSVPPNTTADELATALNALGVEPRDLISIFQALKEAGSLPAKMEIL